MDDSTVHSVSEDERIVQGVIETIAEHEGTEQTDIEPPLHEVINADALTALFDSTPSGNQRRGGQVIFPYIGNKVIIDFAVCREDTRVRVTDWAT